MIVRKAQKTDASGIFAVEREAFSVPWSQAAIQRELQNTALTMYYVLVTDRGDIAGYAGLWHVADEGQITNVAVLPAFRGKGYGELLLRVLMEAAWRVGCASIFLEVRVSNLSAQQLYRKLGYAAVSVRRAYYSQPTEDACVMECKKERYCWSI
ncbi:ribosomal protein S18-alanine N-acetyltransferase [Megasphaera lornae]|uniref:[Ribosomal protein bS18]-alanine N-acetyltransferase n=1 Tax=Megasphaera lornae TaxID=1000568 RepID=D3LX13_9FIRM|nr:ribosomal protein S18-alanine N-acetyltransferase [Megasphaera genomosp. type_1]EFD93400.1 ribosomal-protein-alanine acetyltransferase [Megasphaera genomosp. type_1 str. 28L]